MSRKSPKGKDRNEQLQERLLIATIILIVAQTIQIALELLKK